MRLLFVLLAVFWFSAGEAAEVYLMFEIPESDPRFVEVLRRVNLDRKSKGQPEFSARQFRVELRGGGNFFVPGWKDGKPALFQVAWSRDRLIDVRAVDDRQAKEKAEKQEKARLKVLLDLLNGA